MLSLSSQQMRRLSSSHAQRVMTGFAKEHRINFEWSAYENYKYAWRELELEDLQIIVLLHGYFGIKDMYPVAGMYSTECDHDSTRRSILRRLLFFRTQGVPYGL